jgi:thioredoxin reductase
MNMRRISMIAGSAAGMAAAVALGRNDGFEVIISEPERPATERKRPEPAQPVLKSGGKYPHSSARQQARYARQLAAGQITFIKHGPRS